MRDLTDISSKRQ